MNSQEDNFHLVLALRPDMTDSDAKWAAGVVTEMQAAKARVVELERRMSAIRKAQLDKVEERRDMWTVHVIDDVLPRPTDSVSTEQRKGIDE